MRSRTLSFVLAAALGLMASSCGGGDDLGSERADQVRAAALEAGLPENVADVLALAARGTTATYRITYAGTDGAEVVVSQDPPDHRLDVVTGGVVVESRVLRDGVGYRCQLEEGATLDCERSEAAVDAPGAFTDVALDRFVEELADGADRFDISVEDRSIAGVDATCLVTAPKAGTPIDGEGPGVDTLCLSPEGVQLLTDAGGERVVASDYSTEVAPDAFEL